MRVSLRRCRSACPDLILWIALTAGSPFGGTPDRHARVSAPACRAARRRASRCTIWTICCAASPPPKARWPSPMRRSTDVLQAIRDSVAKAVATNQLALISVVNATPIARRHGEAARACDGKAGPDHRRAGHDGGQRDLHDHRDRPGRLHPGRIGRQCGLDRRRCGDRRSRRDDRDGRRSRRWRRRPA